MAKKRMLYLKFWEDPKTAELPDQERIFVIGCISHADDEGRLLADPASLKASIWKHRSMGSTKVKKIRDEVCQKLRSFCLYSIKGREYIQLKNWRKYQTLREDRITPSWLPEAPTKCQPKRRQTADKMSTKPPTKCQQNRQHRLSNVKVIVKKINKKKTDPNEIQVNDEKTEQDSKPQSFKFLNIFLSKTLKNKKEIPRNVVSKLRNVILRATKVMTEKTYTNVLNRCISFKGTDQAWEYYMDSIWRECEKIEHASHKNETSNVGEILNKAMIKSG